jgi:pectate lyase
MKTYCKQTSLLRIMCLIILVINSCSSDSDRKQRQAMRLESVKAFADNVLEKGIDHWSGKNTPLFADGLNISTNEPLEYHDSVQQENYIISNLASQQNLFRVLVGLSNLTGDPKYRKAAEESIRFHFENFSDKSGLLHWGSREFIDLRTLKAAGGNPKMHIHELKHVFPYYDLMWEVDKEKTKRFISAFWNSQVLNWSNLDFTENGEYNKKIGHGWNHEYDKPASFVEGSGSSAIDAGSDLIYAAAVLASLSGEDSSLIWATRMVEQYAKARDPKTGLMTASYNKLKQIPNGDRAKIQFGMDFPGVGVDSRVLFDGTDIYTFPMLMLFELADRLGERGRVFMDFGLSSLYAYAKYGYKHTDNTFKPMWTDGTDITGYVLKKTGFYGKEGDTLKPVKASGLYHFTYERAIRYSWYTRRYLPFFIDKDTCVVRSMQINLELGDIGTHNRRDINWKTNNSDPYVIFSLLEAHKYRKDKETLMLAEKVADNLKARSFHNGYFLKDTYSVIAEFDAIEPLAILALEAFLRGQPDAVPLFSGGMNLLDLNIKQ